MVNHFLVTPSPPKYPYQNSIHGKNNPQRKIHDVVGPLDWLLKKGRDHKLGYGSQFKKLVVKYIGSKLELHPRVVNQKHPRWNIKNNPAKANATHFWIRMWHTFIRWWLNKNCYIMVLREYQQYSTTFDCSCALFTSSHVSGICTRHHRTSSLVRFWNVLSAEPLEMCSA